MAPIQPKYMVTHYGSFIVKEYRMVLQAAPFVMFTFMNSEMKQVWEPLCYLGSMDLQNHIYDMELFIQKLEGHIRNFMYHIAKINGRWANKPKFHMLLHLPYSIRRFGPPSLFATEKFESYNGIIRNSSIHSNHQSPGRYLANSFSSYQMMRSLVSGTKLHDETRECYFQVATQVREFFDNNSIIQKSLGYNSAQIITSNHFPCLHGNPGKNDPHEVIPEIFLAHYDVSEIVRVKSLKISMDDIIRDGSFFLVNPCSTHINSVLK